MSEAAPRLDVACSARRDYLPHTATMIASLLANGDVRARVHLLVGADVSEAEAGAVAEMTAAGGGELVVHRIGDERLGSLKTTGTLPTAHWYRVLLPELLADVERALYLDGDLIVVDSLRPLAELDLGPNRLAAVSNPFPDTESAARLCAGLGLESTDLYFNSGVMVLDLEALREDDVAARVIRFGAENAERLFLPEQDAMNAVLADRRLPLAPRWNAMISVQRFAWSERLFGADAVREARERPAIRHFEGSGTNKPWHPEADPEHRRLYEGYRRRTPWPDLATELEPR